MDSRLKIFVERVIETTESGSVNVPHLDGSWREIPGERRQALEIVIRADTSAADGADVWREQVGRTLTVIPWEQEPSHDD